MTTFCKDCRYLRQEKKPWYDYWNEIIIAENCAAEEVRRPTIIDYVTGEMKPGRMPPARQINREGNCSYFEERSDV